ncbi:MAG TPA: LysM peptidoglycan-binding domain-containing protein [Anaerolineales bacterium]|nr:LysM peptidoglycan-binding domain-containing protein [Anaerolineales bacterium]
MARLKRGIVIASTLMLIAVIVSACSKPFSTPPAVTNTPFNQSLFATPIGQTPGVPSMSDVERFMTDTAVALSGTPLTVATQTPSTPVGIGTQNVGVTVTPTPLISINPATATLAVSGGGTLPTSMPVGSRPATYTLQSGEFVFCIARRFDVDPDQVLSLNGLSDGQTVYPGKVLKIPQSGSFPGTRALRNHPATYTVASSSENIYSVACKFGDVDPAAIAQANNLSPSAALTTGQQLSIP